MRIFPVALSGLMLVVCAHGTGAVVSGPMGEDLDRYMARLAENGFSGALLVTKDGETVIQRGYGLADREGGIAVTPETVFDIGSITKQFTAAGIMKLAEEGKLSVEDSISDYFEDVPEDKAGITVHHLLTHTAGLRMGFGRDYTVMTRDALVEAALTGRLAFGVGERYFYSNAGYSLLAAIIELVSGMGYEAYLRAVFFEPLGMDHTGYVAPDWDGATVAAGYRGGERWGTPLEHLWAEDGPYWNLKGNGGILSTVVDMRIWHEALLGDDVLSAETRETIFAPHADEGDDGFFYGYGWSVFERVPGKHAHAHNGGNGFFFADCYRYVDDGFFLVVMTNNARDFPMEALDLRRILFDLEYALPELNPPDWVRR